MSIRLRDRRPITAALAVLLLAAGLAMRAPTVRAQAVAELSPEQAALQVVPYRLTAADLPAGYAPAPRQSYGEPIGYALLNAPAGADPRPVFEDRRRKGYILDTDQVLLDAPRNGLPAAILYVYVMNSPDAAWARTEGLIDGYGSSRSVQTRPIDPGIALGDDVNAWHIASTSSANVSAGGYYLRWQRGALTFTIATSAPFGSEKLQDAVALALAADKKGQAAPPPDASAITAPVTEAQRFDDVLQLRDLLGGVATPAGFQAGDPTLSTPAGAVLDPAADPYQALMQIDSEQRWIASYARQFATSEGSAGVRLAVGASLYSDAVTPLAIMARSQAADPSDDFFTPPAGLPEKSYAVRIPGTADPSRVAVTVRWAHGPLMLSAVLSGSNDQITDDLVNALVTALELSYQAGPFAGS